MPATSKTGSEKTSFTPTPYSKTSKSRKRPSSGDHTPKETGLDDSERKAARAISQQATQRLRDTTTASPHPPSPSPIPPQKPLDKTPTSLQEYLAGLDVSIVKDLLKDDQLSPDSLAAKDAHLKAKASKKPQEDTPAEENNKEDEDMISDDGDENRDLSGGLNQMEEDELPPSHDMDDIVINDEPLPLSFGTSSTSDVTPIPWPYRKNPPMTQFRGSLRLSAERIEFVRSPEDDELPPLPSFFQLEVTDRSYIESFKAGAALVLIAQKQREKGLILATPKWDSAPLLADLLRFLLHEAGGNLDDGSIYVGDNRVVITEINCMVGLALTSTAEGLSTIQNLVYKGIQSLRTVVATAPDDLASRINSKPFGINLSYFAVVPVTLDVDNALSMIKYIPQLDDINRFTLELATPSFGFQIPTVNEVAEAFKLNRLCGNPSSFLIQLQRPRDKSPFSFIHGWGDMNTFKLGIVNKFRIEVRGRKWEYLYRPRRPGKPNAM